jgi:hypothetical protein
MGIHLLQLCVQCNMIKILQFNAGAVGFINSFKKRTEENGPSDHQRTEKCHLQMQNAFFKRAFL